MSKLDTKTTTSQPRTCPPARHGSPTELALFGSPTEESADIIVQPVEHSRRNVTIDNLSPEILLVVFKYVKRAHHWLPWTKIASYNVCGYWRDVINTNAILWNTINEQTIANANLLRSYLKNSVAVDLHINTYLRSDYFRLRQSNDVEHSRRIRQAVCRAQSITANGPTPNLLAIFEGNLTDAPRLESLSLFDTDPLEGSPSPFDFGFNPTSLPPLKSLYLSYIRFTGWNVVGLFSQLYTLTIKVHTGDEWDFVRAPSMDAMIQALAASPYLHTVKLVNCLPIAASPPLGVRTKPVMLSSIVNLYIADQMDICFDLLRRVELPRDAAITAEYLIEEEADEATEQHVADLITVLNAHVSRGGLPTHIDISRSDETLEEGDDAQPGDFVAARIRLKNQVTGASFVLMGRWLTKEAFILVVNSVMRNTSISGIHSATLNTEEDQFAPLVFFQWQEIARQLNLRTLKIGFFTAAYESFLAFDCSLSSAKNLKSITFHNIDFGRVTKHCVQLDLRIRIFVQLNTALERITFVDCTGVQEFVGSWISLKGLSEGAFIMDTKDMTLKKLPVIEFSLRGLKQELYNLLSAYGIYEQLGVGPEEEATQDIQISAAILQQLYATAVNA